jgi:hypothetical protein
MVSENPPTYGTRTKAPPSRETVDGTGYPGIILGNTCIGIELLVNPDSVISTNFCVPGFNFGDKHRRRLLVKRTAAVICSLNEQNITSLLKWYPDIVIDAPPFTEIVIGEMLTIFGTELKIPSILNVKFEDSVVNDNEKFLRTKSKGKESSRAEIAAFASATDAAKATS